MEDIAAKRTKHLILLVGMNPLPNYVAAKLLLEEGGTLYLLHSANTRGEAHRLKAIVDGEVQLGEIEEADAIAIEQKITDWVREIPSGERVGLNYTGGTKVMAVHAHHAFLQATQTRSAKSMCSYLDARTYEMKFDPIGGGGGNSIPVLKALNVPLQTLLALHDIELQGLEKTRIALSQPARLLADLHKNDYAARKWREWCNTELRHEATRKGWGWETKDAKLSGVTLMLPADDVFADFNRRLCVDLGMQPSGKIALAELQKNRPFSKKYHLLKWLDGIWLEHYVFEEISAVKDEAGIHDAAMSLDTERIAGKPDFEFDVGAMKGYQLFGISCSTTQNRGLAKSKLFEAFIRAKQLGGDEARVGLVIPQAGLKKLEKELPESVSGKVRIFDSSHIRNLRQHLQDWFEYPDSY